jgi:polysaccharide chain length determinant protein (PEP-CTERM system associated)
MQDIFAKITLLRIYLSGIWHRKRYIMLTMWIGCLLGWLAVSIMPNLYESSAKVYADTRSLLKPLLKGLAVQKDPDEEIRIIAKTLLSRQNLEDIVRDADLALGSSTDEEYEVLLNNLKADIALKMAGQKNLYSITYNHKDPKTAQKVVEITMDKFVSATMGQSKIDSESAENFLADQIELYKVKLEAVENELAEFKRKNQALLPGRDANYYQKTTQLGAEIENIDLLLRERQAQLDILRSRFLPDSTQDVDGQRLSSHSVQTPYDERLNSLKTRLDQIRIRYTDQHPDVVELQQIIKSMQVLKNKAHDKILNQVSLGAMTAGQGQEGNALQEFALKISDLESDIEALKIRRLNYAEKLASLSEKLELIPDIEAQLTSLNRDYRTTKSSYEELLKRQGSAELSRSADESNGDVNFKVLEAPRVPLTPNGPKRIVFYTVILFFSGLLGVGFAFISSQLSSVVSSPAHLKLLVGEQGSMLGQIEHSDIASIKSRLRFKSIIFVTTTTLLLLGFSALVGHEIVFGHSPIMWIK